MDWWRRSDRSVKPATWHCECKIVLAIEHCECIVRDMTPTTNVAGCECAQCGHRWTPVGGEKPKRCARCKTTAWDRAKRKAGRPRSLPVEVAFPPAVEVSHAQASLLDSVEPDESPLTPQALRRAIHKSVAGGPISETGQGQHDPSPDAYTPETSSSGLQPASAKPKSNVPTCPHGKQRGFHCWQCQGIAKVQS